MAEKSIKKCSRWEHFLLNMFEVSVCSVNKLEEGEGLAVAGDNLLEIVELMLIDYADKHILFRLRVSADCAHLCDPVAVDTADGQLAAADLVADAGDL